MLAKIIKNAVYVFKLNWERCRLSGCIPQYVLESSKMQNQILQIYIKAQKINVGSKVKVETDHIIPIFGELVSGLHTPFNLRVISQTSNQAKSNKFRPYSEKDGEIIWTT